MFNKVGKYSFQVVANVRELRVLAVGGGGGGPNGHSGGGGSGYVTVDTVDVKQGDVFEVVVADGGKGGDRVEGTNLITGNANGGTSKLGVAIEAEGGKSVYPIAGQWQDAFNENGGDGGSGGGAAGYKCVQGHGGAEGNDGANCGSNDAGDWPPIGEGGKGQGNYMKNLTIFKENWFAAGEGGLNIPVEVAGGWVPGGGAGGILLNGFGPEGGNGEPTYGGKGGNGYGAGGGPGGLNGKDWVRCAGGNGAPGLIYIEWD